MTQRVFSKLCTKKTVENICSCKNLNTDVHSSMAQSSPKLETTQQMEFPRNYELPQDIKNAVCEEAIALLKNKNNIHQQNQENNIASIQLGVGSVSYQFDTTKTQNLSSRLAFQLIQKWIKKGYNLYS